MNDDTSIFILSFLLLIISFILYINHLENKVHRKQLYSKNYLYSYKNAVIDDFRTLSAWLILIICACFVLTALFSFVMEFIDLI